MTRAVAAIAAAFVACLGFSGEAYGHAQLISSNPGPDQVLRKAPERVEFHFNEAVSTDLGEITVIGPAGDVLAEGIPVPDPRDPAVVSIALPRSPDKGTYTATYRVVSADSHPISGGFSFTVRQSSSTGEGATAAVSPPSAGAVVAGESGTRGSTEVVFWLCRLLALATTTLLVGVLVFLWSSGVLRAAAGRSKDAGPAAGRRAGVLVGAGVVIGIVAVLLMIPAQGATVAASTIGAGFDSGTLRSVAESRFGSVNLLRAAAFLTFIPIAIALSRGRSPGPSYVLLAALGSAVLFVAPGQAGHAATADPSWLVMPASVLHTASMAIWGGGLVAMALLLNAPPVSPSSDRSKAVLATLERFSPVALICALALAITGTAQAVVEVGSPEDLVESSFGRLVLAKVAVFLVLVVLGWNNRSRLLPALAAFVAKRSGPDTSARLLRSVTGGAFLVVLALMLTSALVAEEPKGLAPPGPPSGMVETSGYRLDFLISPGLEGRNEVTLRLELEPGSRPPTEATLAASNDNWGSGAGSSDLGLQRSGRETYISPNAVFDRSGEWQFRAEFRTGRFDVEVFEFEAEIASAE
ncbi:MAG: copper resistance CopC/CopD family protein [bacterium]